MINIIIFSVISSFIIAVVLFLEESSTQEKDVDIMDYIKHFTIAFIVNFIFFMIFKSLISKNVFSEPVEVGLLD